MTRYDRRTFLRRGAAGLAGGALIGSAARPAWAQLAGPISQSEECPILEGAPAKKLMVIFLRGGNDGTNTAPPVDDPLYYSQRTLPDGQTIAIDATDAIDIGAPGLAMACKLHPAMQAVMPIYDQGDLAIIQRVGYRGSSRSHFNAQQHWETAVVSDLIEEGFLARYLNQVAALIDPLPGASFYQAPQLMLTTPTRAFPQIADLPGYRFQNQTLFGTPPDAANPNGKGLLGAYQAAADSPVRRDGQVLLQSMDIIQNTLPPNYPNGTAGAYPDTPLGHYARDAAWVLMNTDCRAAVVSDGGYDHHRNQGGAEPGGKHYQKLASLAQTLKAVYDVADSVGLWNRLAVAVISEFGRSDINESGGTDHGNAGVALVMGGRVRGGPYNCDLQTYYDAGGVSPLQPEDGAMKHRTDFRAIYAEILRKHLDLCSNQVNDVIPNWSNIATAPHADHPHEFEALGLFG